MRKFSHQRFEPSGFTKNPEIRNASSITDYIFRWMAFQFVPGYREANSLNSNQQELAMPGLLEEIKKKINKPVSDLPLSDDTEMLSVKVVPNLGNGASNGRGSTHARTVNSLSDAIAHFQQDAPTCPNCGHITVRDRKSVV